MEETALHAKLVLDDAASATADHIKKGVEHVSHEAEHSATALHHMKEAVGETAREFAGFGRDVAAAFLGFEIGGLVEGVKELGHEFFGASAAAEEQTKSMAGVLTVMGEAEGTFEQTKRAAGELRGRLDEMATAGGVDIAQVVEGFDEMALRSEKSADQVEDLTEKMIYAGRAVPGGFNGIAEGFRAMETGVIRANNPIVNLIKQTGNLDGSAKQIAKTLTAMAQKGDLEGVMALGEQAIEKVGAKMKDVQPSFAEMQASLRNVREEVFQEGGKPILAALLPVLGDLKGFLEENKEAIGRYAEVLGTKVGNWVTKASGYVKEGFEFIDSHADEIEGAIEEGFTLAREAMSIITDHADEIGATIKGAFGYAKEVLDFLVAHEGLVKALAVGYAGGKLLGAVAPGASAIGSAVSAAGGVGFALRTAANVGNFTVGTSSAVGLSGGASTVIGSAVAEMGTAGAAAATLGAGLLAVGAVAAAGYEAWELYNDVVKDSAKDFDAVQRTAKEMAEQEKVAGENAEYFSNRLTDALASGDEAKIALAEVAQAAYEAASAMRSMASDVGALHGAEVAHEIGAAAGNALTMMMTQASRDFLQTGKRLGELKAKDVHLNMSGTKVEVKQEFRDMDPDRVAIAFERKMGRAVVDRISSSLSTPFT